MNKKNYSCKLPYPEKLKQLKSEKGSLTSNDLDSERLEIKHYRWACHFIVDIFYMELKETITFYCNKFQVSESGEKHFLGDKNV